MGTSDVAPHPTALSASRTPPCSASLRLGSNRCLSRLAPTSTMNADPSPSTRSASESSPAGEGDATPQLPSKRRASKACESCRISRQRCSGDEPCTRCSVRRMECNYRQKARPGRAPRGSLRAGLSEGEGGMRRQQAKEPAVIGIRAVEKDVERLYLAKTGREADFLRSQ